MIRTLSVRGLILGGLPPLVTRERIRIAIIEQRLTYRSFDGAQTFEQAYWLCYCAQVEMRSVPRAVIIDDDEDEESH